MLTYPPSPHFRLPESGLKPSAANPAFCIHDGEYLMPTEYAALSRLLVEKNPAKLPEEVLGAGRREISSEGNFIFTTRPNALSGKPSHDEGFSTMLFVASAFVAGPNYHYVHPEKLDLAIRYVYSKAKQDLLCIGDYPSAREYDKPLIIVGYKLWNNGKAREHGNIIISLKEGANLAAIEAANFLFHHEKQGGQHAKAYLFFRLYGPLAGSDR